MPAPGTRGTIAILNRRNQSAENWVAAGSTELQVGTFIAPAGGSVTAVCLRFIASHVQKRVHFNVLSVLGPRAPGLPGFRLGPHGAGATPPRFRGMVDETEGG